MARGQRLEGGLVADALDKDDRPQAGLGREPPQAGIRGAHAACCPFDDGVAEPRHPNHATQSRTGVVVNDAHSDE